MEHREFFETLRAQCAILPWIHTIAPPAKGLELAELPADYKHVLAEADGFALSQTRMRGELVGAAFEVPSLAGTVPLSTAMYGPRGPRKGVPAWLQRSRVVGRHTDGSFYVGLDPVSSAYYSVEPIVVGEAEIVARSSSQYLRWLMRFLPSSEELHELLASDTEA